MKGTECRVDLAFIFQGGKSKFFIENKIWNRDYHIAKYGQAINNNPNITFGIISNHQLSSQTLELAKKYNWKIKYWPEFIDFLNPTNYGDARQIIEGYLAYVKEVCSIKPIKKIEFIGGNLTSLYYLNNLFEKIINMSTRPPYNYKIIRGAFGCSWSGFIYSMQHTVSKENIKAWFGIDFSSEPQINIGLHDSWNKGLRSRLLKVEIKENNFFQLKFVKRRVVFNFPQDMHHLFIQSECGKQEELLASFFEKVNAEFEKLLEATANRQV